ncbi:AsmA family protein [bacterium]|nr:AsmA family protein [bacterium]
MKRILVRIVVVLLALVVVLYLARNFIARKSVEVAVSQITGFPLEIGSVSVGLFQSTLDVREIKLSNPPEFEEPQFVHLPQVSVDYRLGSMIARSPHINDLTLDIATVVIVKNKDGVSNVSQLKSVAASAGGDEAGSAQPPAEPEPKTPYRVDQLHLKIGTLVIKDYSQGKPSERTIPLNIDATYKNITDSTDIPRLVLVTMMSKVALPDIGVNVDQLKQGLGNVTDTAGNAVKGAAEAVGDVGKGIFDTIKKAVPGK